MSENQTDESGLSDEFRNFGKNLVKASQAAWDSPQRRRLQEEIESGLNEVRNVINRETDQLVASPTTQKLKKDIDDFSERVRSSDVENTIRSELLDALRTVNLELEKLTERWSSGSQNESVPQDDEREGEGDSE